MNIGSAKPLICLWKKQYAGQGPSELRQFREESGKLKRLVADLLLDRRMLREIVRQNRKTSPSAQVEALGTAAFVVSERRVARLLPIQLATLRSRPNLQIALRIRRRELAASQARFGYPRLTGLLRREGWAMNAKRIGCTPKTD